MKAACIILSLIIFVAIMAICVMVKFATDITVEERKREFQLSGEVYQVTKSIAVIALNDNLTQPMANRFPYVVAIARNSSKSWSFACFGTVILVKWIVTSAHCRRQGSSHRVLLLYDFARNVTRTYPVLFWRIHEKFNNSNPTPKYDIAVAKLNVDSYPFSLKSATFDERPATDIEASIWKTVATMDRKVFLTNDFANFSMIIAPNDKCFENYGVHMDSSLICVDLSEHEDCFVHEFGPIFSGDKIVGILAVKPRECDIKLAIFTNISYYANWILKLTQTSYYG
ncbi:trypsin beta-like [Epargyreus clarus]|uniref:trypsin beta-like n=1 Tax=Epargyreus clarus TaxID=520877 RepID=UPI003C2C0741